MNNVHKMSASAVLSGLERRMFKRPAHAMLREIRNATGYAHFARTADALVVSLWPSRGIWFAAVEVKVSRSDWLREVAQPQKAEEISKFCEYQWVATPPGIVQLHELPSAWGLVEVTTTKTKVVKAAPHRKTEPLRADFVAAVLRNRADWEDGCKQRVKDELATEAMNATEPASMDVVTLRAQLERSQATVKTLRQQHAERDEVLAKFEKASGVRVDSYGAGPIGAAVALAQQFDYERLEHWAAKFGHLGEMCRVAHAELVQTRLPLSSRPPPPPLFGEPDAQPELGDPA